jgi:hypothetical protein
MRQKRKNEKEINKPALNTRSRSIIDLTTAEDSSSSSSDGDLKRTKHSHPREVETSTSSSSTNITTERYTSSSSSSSSCAESMEADHSPPALNTRSSSKIKQENIDSRTNSTGSIVMEYNSPPAFNTRSSSNVEASSSQMGAGSSSHASSSHKKSVHVNWHKDVVSPLEKHIALISTLAGIASRQLPTYIVRLNKLPDDLEDNKQGQVIDSFIKSCVKNIEKGRFKREFFQEALQALDKKYHDKLVEFDDSIPASLVLEYNLALGLYRRIIENLESLARDGNTAKYLENILQLPNDLSQERIERIINDFLDCWIGKSKADLESSDFKKVIYSFFNKFYRDKQLIDPEQIKDANIKAAYMALEADNLRRIEERDALTPEINCDDVTQTDELNSSSSSYHGKGEAQDDLGGEEAEDSQEKTYHYSEPKEPSLAENIAKAYFKFLEELPQMIKDRMLNSLPVEQMIEYFATLDGVKITLFADIKDKGYNEEQSDQEYSKAAEVENDYFDLTGPTVLLMAGMIQHVNGCE